MLPEKSDLLSPFSNCVNDVFGVWIMADKVDCHFMDKAEPGKKVSEEVARESLISISYCLPDQVFTSKPCFEKVNGEILVADVDSETDEDKFRSELISISELQSPEIGSLPVAK